MIDKRIKYYQKIKEDRENGVYNYIPFHTLPTLAKYVPGIIPGTQYLLFAPTSVGKSSIGRFLFIETAYTFIKDNPQSGLSLRIMLNALEETADEIIDILVCARLYRKGFNVSVNQLNGYGKPVSNNIINAIKKEIEYFNDLKKYLYIYDIGNVFGFYRVIREYAKNNGKFYQVDEITGETIKEVNPSKKDKNGKYTPWNEYRANNPKEIVITMSDHIGLYEPEKGKTRYDTIRDLSAKYSRRIICKKFNYVSVLIQQANAESASKQFNYKGALVIEKNEPSLDHLAEMKLTKNDALVVMALMNPFVFAQEGEYIGYDLEQLDEYFRLLFILKNRKGGGVGAKLPLFFNGAANLFKELPPPDSKLMDKVYNKIKNIKYGTTN